jgi:uncharacterized Zn finger protein
MFNTCPECGLYNVEKEIIDSGNNSFAKCPACGYMHNLKSCRLLF